MQEECLLTKDLESLFFVGVFFLLWFFVVVVNTTRILQKRVPSTQNTYHILELAILRIAKIIWRTMKDTENSWKTYVFQGGGSAARMSVDKYTLGSTTVHYVNKASRIGHSASAGVCVKYIWLN